MKSKEHHVNLSCSLCGKSQREVRQLIAGPTVYICDACVRGCNDVISQRVGDSSAGPLAKTARQLANGLRDLEAFPLSILERALLLAKELESLSEPKEISPATSKRPHDVRSCSFCGKAENEIQYLIARRSVYICDECISLCLGILAESEQRSLQHYAQIAGKLALNAKKLSKIPGVISDRTSSLAVELERYAGAAKPS